MSRYNGANSCQYDAVMKLFYYSAAGMVAALIVLWGALIVDSANILQQMSELMHYIEDLFNPRER
ncbi:Uncharacterised protein [Cedecea neteri]|uniref:Uncharacterized protein n=1 Tax=Cedecea neteri TaxID=158822 RepID=A0A2X3JD69_9ENTR|nr:Uncharacterised protein [Cedecea neteri]